MVIAYADPPYLGQAAKHYQRAEVNHRLLIAHLCDEFPDGWALSCSTSSLQDLLSMCPLPVRVAAWVKPYVPFKVGINPAYAWEPVIFRGGRRRERTEPTVRDWCLAHITMQRGLVGAKPEAFSFWLFALLGLQPTDTFVDLFPGTGGVSQAWESYRRQQTLKLVFR
jgi:hypothetical protein